MAVGRRGFRIHLASLRLPSAAGHHAADFHVSDDHLSELARPRASAARHRRDDAFRTGEGAIPVHSLAAEHQPGHRYGDEHSGLSERADQSVGEHRGEDGCRREGRALRGRFTPICSRLDTMGCTKRCCSVTRPPLKKSPIFLAISFRPCRKIEKPQCSAEWTAAMLWI